MPKSFWLEMRPVDDDDEYSAAPLEVYWTWLETYPDGTVDYKVEFRVERGNEVGAHRFMVAGFNPQVHNLLGLLKLTLDQLVAFQMENGT